METRPPALIESVVRLLVPPVAREHVLGDLAERYSSPGQYVAEAARTVPLVIASQVRRTSYFAAWPMVGIGLALGFGRGGKQLWLSGAIPAFAALIGFMVRDAYRVPDLQHPQRQGLVDLAFAGGAAWASQVVVGLVRPEWLIASPGLTGGALVLAVLYLLRLQNPTGRVTHTSSS
jgi:hypothetical protein